MRRGSATFVRARRGLRAAISIALGAGLIVVFLAVPASAVVTCSVAGTTLDIVLDVGDGATVEVEATTNNILVNGSSTTACGATVDATTTGLNAVNTIDVTGSTGDESFTIDQGGSGGAFPAAFDFDVALAGGTGDTLNIDGGSGNDTITFGGSASAASINLQNDSSADVATSGVEEFDADGNNGNDTITGNGGAGTGTGAFTGALDINGGDGSDLLTGGSGADAINGGAGDDTINGQTGNDTLTGAAGTDEVLYSNASAAVTVNLSLIVAQNTGGAGTDILSTFENLTGSAFNDVLTGDAGGNRILGLGGNDIIEGLAGDDTLTGGDGLDTASFATAGVAVTVNLSVAAAQNTGVGNDTLGTIETLTGSAFSDSLTGDLGNNVLFGGDGNDLLAGLLGDDTLTGGNGVDTSSYAAAGAGVTVNLSFTTPQNTGGAGIDTLGTIENLIGSLFNDVLIGDANANALDGGDGDDTLAGLAGNDALVGGNGVDTASFATSAAGVVASLAGGTATGDGSDTLATLENLIGTSKADTLTGDASDNRLEGGAGRDDLVGLKGNDTLLSGDGKDSIDAGGGDDIARGGNGNDEVKGGPGDDGVYGQDGNDDLFGGGGDDKIRGGPGNDECKGGPGNNDIKGCED